MSTFSGMDRIEDEVPLKPVAGLDPAAIAAAFAPYRFTYEEATHTIFDPGFAPPKLIMQFRPTPDGTGYDQFITQMPNYYIKGLIAHLPQELKQPLYDALGKDLNKVRIYPNYHGRSLLRDEKIRDYNHRFPQEKAVGTFTTTHAQHIGQNQIGLSDANAPYPILGTYGAGPCIIAALYNPTTRIGLLTHADSKTDLASLTESILALGPETLELHLSGGSYATKRVLEINRYFKQFPNVKLKTSYLNPDSNERLALDMRDGKIYTDFDVHTLNSSPLPPSWREPRTAGTRPVKMAYDYREDLPEKKTHTARLNDQPSAFSRGSKHTKPAPRNGGWTDKEPS